LKTVAALAELLPGKSRNAADAAHGALLVSAVMATADACARESQRLFRPQGLAAAQSNVLKILAAEPKGISRRAPGDRLVVDRSNVAGLLDRLEKSRWARGTDDPDNRRVYRTKITPDGRTLWQTVTPLYFEVVTQITRGLEPKQIAGAFGVLRQPAAGAFGWKF
jgi:MarR family 2-MHQ and catechol resistance regulon transcriptional repressor